jgi:branched-chain amino acid aminotransferase
MTAETYTFHDGAWHEGNPPMFGPMAHALWMASSVFDGARAFGRLAPDLDRHCQRVIESALSFGMSPVITAKEIERLAWEGIEKFPEDAELYIRPLFYFADGFVTPVLESAKFMLSVFVAPMPAWRGTTACLSPYRRPSPESAPTAAKASCLYPNVARAMMDARNKGFDSAVVLDPIGNVAEFTTSNLFVGKDGVVMTPVPNGTFLPGLTRRRVIELLRGDGVEIRECTLRFQDVLDADEVFLTGNFPKVLPVVKIEDQEYQQGQFAQLARKLYFEFAEREGPRKI